MPKKKPQTRPLPSDWVVTHSFAWNGRRIEPGTELSISGQRGRFRFIKHVRTGTTEWIDVVGGKNNLDRSFHPEKIKTVHRLKKTRGNAA
jgi:hypothetical protein